MRLVAEFTTEPFHGEGKPPAHAVAALKAVEGAGLEVEFGPLGTTVSGEADEVVGALADVLRSALSHGATGVRIEAQLVGPDGRPMTQRGASGGSPSTSPSPSEPAADLATLIAGVADEIGGPLAELSRADKQRAVRMLEERGAFAYRRSAETIAEAIGVSRFTVYNYLNRTR